MRMFLKCFTLVFIFGTALIVPASVNAAVEYRVIPVTEYVCKNCNWQCFTFAPDNIEAEKNNDNKDVNYQQRNWLVFLTGSPIRKCGKSPDGAHFFTKRSDRDTSPYVLSERREDYIVLKNGGSIKATVSRFKCVHCSFEGFYFKGDRLHMSCLYSDQMCVYNMKNKSQIKDCNWEFEGVRFKVHRFNRTSSGNPSSMNLLGQIQNLWFSDKW